MSMVGRGVKNAFRNLVRTGSIVIILGISVGLALAMLLAHQAVSNRISTVKASVGNTITISPAGVRGFEGGGSPLTQDQIAKLAKINHVVSINESLNDRLTSSQTNLQSAVDAGTLGRRFSSNSGQTFVPPSGAFRNGDNQGTFNFTPPVTVTGTTEPNNLNNTQGGGTFTLKNGQLFGSDTIDNVALVGNELAAKNKLSTGSTFTAYGATIKVIGIFDSGNTFSNNQLIMPLSVVQKLSSQPGQLTSAVVKVDSISNIDTVTSAVKSSLGASADVTNSKDQAQSTLTPLQNIANISLYSLIGALIAGAAIVLLSMIMIVRERRREIGVLKAIGASNFKVMGQFMVEAVTLTILGAVVGILIGLAAANPITKTLVNNANDSNTVAQMAPSSLSSGPGRTFRSFGGSLRSNLNNISADVGWDVVGYGVGAAVIIGLIGSCSASWLITRIRPAEVMRTE